MCINSILIVPDKNDRFEMNNIRNVVAILSVICVAQLSVADEEFADIFTFGSRIIGGTPVLNRTQCPYQVSLVHNRRQHFCGGSILNPTSVLTAAHCVFNMNPNDFTVETGHLNLNQSNKIVANVSRVIVHPGWNASSLQNDIAIIKLSSNLTLNPNVQPIPLSANRPADNSTCTVTGWGSLNESGPISNNLMTVNVNVVSQASCNSSYGSIITNNMVCAAAPGKDACQGDSGGPLTFNGTLVGLVSFGIGCAIPTYPGVYTDVTKYISWIMNNTMLSTYNEYYYAY